ncbi:MAG: HAMP domain-containing protein [Deltaproteobacteria bacterium]|nr:HAMP domain-containing protein [Deltaproteobacteria bacterium]
MTFRISRTALRIGGAFAAVLALFGISLLVTLRTLDEIARAEAEVARLDHAKHAGHLAAARVREQYIHQAHTLITWSVSHLNHYPAVVRDTENWTGHLRHVARTPEEKELAEEVAALARQNDREFQTKVVPAVRRDDRSQIRDFHEHLESQVNQVVRLNEALNARFEKNSRAAHARASALRSQARTGVITCFGLAIAIAAGVALLIMRSILRPVSALRQGALRIAQGDLSKRIDLPGHDEFAELAATFNRMTEDLERNQRALLRAQKLASIGQIAAGVAHEINNPLGVILGHVKLLQRSMGPMEELKIIEEETRQCQRIVEGLLDLSRTPRLENGPVDLGELARDAVERLEESGKLQGREVAVPDRATRVLARGDEAKLRQVVLNVLLNAAEAVPEGGAIRLEASRMEGEAILAVIDTGPGIAAEIIPRLFDPFVTTKPKGTGLGLAISQKIVEAHGGRIDIRSGPDEGTRVAVCLPASEEHST